MRSRKDAGRWLPGFALNTASRLLGDSSLGDNWSSTLRLKDIELPSEDHSSDPRSVEVVLLLKDCSSCPKLIDWELGSDSFLSAGHWSSCGKLDGWMLSLLPPGGMGNRSGGW
jgi:hypothetical protein